MAKGDCKRRTVRFAKAGARFLGPVLGALVPQMVGALRVLGDSIPELSGGRAKRKAVFQAVASEAEKLGHAAYDAARKRLTHEAVGFVRAHIQNALYNLESGESVGTLMAWAEEDETADAPEDADPPLPG